MSSTYLNWRLRYNYFRFWKNKRPPYWKSTFGFDFGHLPEICTLFCIRLPNFVQIEAPTAEIWRHIHFSKWRLRRLNITSGFVSVDVTAFRRSKSISKPDLSRYLKWRLIYFYGNPKWLGKGSIFLNSRMCQYPGMLCYILWIQFPRWGSGGWKTTYGGKKQVHRDWYCMTISLSSHPLIVLFPAIFVLKYQTQYAGSRASEMVHIGSRFWNVVAMDFHSSEGCTPPAYLRSSSFGQQLAFCCRIKWGNNIGLIKRVSWKEH